MKRVISVVEFQRKVYSSVLNRRVGRNKRAGGKIFKKTLNMQGKIDLKGGKST